QSDFARISWEVSQPGRDLMFATTGDEPAVFHHGGLFTKALIKGLKGGADLQHKGVIWFRDLAFFVTNEVRSDSDNEGGQQVPYARQVEHFGGGNIVFLFDQ